MKTILASVYAVNPYNGSEDGTGWNLVLQIARFNKVIAVTRCNNQPHIERYLKENVVPEAKNIEFEYYDLPYWMRFWKKGSRGALLYYYLWQMGLPHFVRKRKLQFDITHIAFDGKRKIFFGMRILFYPPQRKGQGRFLPLILM